MMKVWYGKKLPEQKHGTLGGKLRYDLHERENCRKVVAYEVPNVIYDFRGEERHDVIIKSQKRKLLRYIDKMGYNLEVNVSGPFLELRRKKREVRPLTTT